VFVLSLPVTSAHADDVSDEFADDAPEVYADDVSDEYTDDDPDEYTDDASEEYEDEDVDEDPSPGFGRKAWDATLLRPLNFIRLVAGCVLTIPVSVIVLPSGTDNFLDTADYFVGQPYWDTFERPLGKF
jgi:hypothetical protein